MKAILFLLILSLMVGTGSADNKVIRDIVVYDKEIHITINPDPYNNFSLPGYYVEETIPYKYVFKSTTADWYVQSGQTLKMIRLLPTLSNRNITYILTNYGSESSIDITGLYMDKNKNEGVIVNVEKSNKGTSSEATSGSDGHGWVHGEKPTASDVAATTAQPGDISALKAQQVQPAERGQKRPPMSQTLIILLTATGLVSMLAYGYEPEIRAALKLNRKPRVFTLVNWEPATDVAEKNQEAHIISEESIDNSSPLVPLM